MSQTTPTPPPPVFPTLRAQIVLDGTALPWSPLWLTDTDFDAWRPILETEITSLVFWPGEKDPDFARQNIDLAITERYETLKVRGYKSFNEAVGKDLSHAAIHPLVFMVRPNSGFNSGEIADLARRGVSAGVYVWVIDSMSEPQPAELRQQLAELSLFDYLHRARDTQRLELFNSPPQAGWLLTWHDGRGEDIRTMTPGSVAVLHGRSGSGKTYAIEASMNRRFNSHVHFVAVELSQKGDSILELSRSLHQIVLNGSGHCETAVIVDGWVHVLRGLQSGDPTTRWAANGVIESLKLLLKTERISLVLASQRGSDFDDLIGTVIADTEEGRHSLTICDVGYPSSPAS